MNMFHHRKFRCPKVSQEGSNIDSENDKVSPCGQEANRRLQPFDSNSWKLVTTCRNTWCFLCCFVGTSCKFVVRHVELWTRTGLIIFVNELWARHVGAHVMTDKGWKENYLEFHVYLRCHCNVMHSTCAGISGARADNPSNPTRTIRGIYCTLFQQRSVCFLPSDLCIPLQMAGWDFDNHDTQS